MAATVKPTAEEQMIINKRLRKKYPQMFQSFSKDIYFSKKKKTVGQRLRGGLARMIARRANRVSPNKTTTSAGESKISRSVEDRLGKAGLTESEISKLKGNKK